MTTDEKRKWLRQELNKESFQQGPWPRPHSAVIEILSEVGLSWGKGLFSADDEVVDRAYLAFLKESMKS